MNTSDIIREIAIAGHHAPSADNSQPWHFTWDGESLDISYDTQRVGGKTFPPDSPATLIALGGAIENFFLLFNDCPATFELEMFPSSTAMAKFTFQEVQAMGNPRPKLTDSAVSKRHTNRYPYKRDPIPRNIIDKLVGVAEGNARTMILTSPQDKKTIADLVIQASHSRFQTREAHELLASSLRFSEEENQAGDGMDVSTLALPPGGPQFLKFIRDWKRMSVLNRLGAYRLLAKLDAKPLTQAPMILGICAPATQEGAIEAGRLITRAWTYLNDQDLAVHPYYVISDQLARFSKGGIPEHLNNKVSDLERRSKDFFSLQSGETLHMLMRLGYPTRVAPRSRRVSINMVFTDLTCKDPNT